MMQSKAPTMLAGMGIGMAVGAAAVAGMSMMSGSGRKAAKKNAAKLMKTLDSVMDGIASLTK